MRKIKLSRNELHQKGFVENLVRLINTGWENRKIFPRLEQHDRNCIEKLELTQGYSSIISLAISKIGSEGKYQVHDNKISPCEVSEIRDKLIILLERIKSIDVNEVVQTEEEKVYA